jgi:glycosyltransferase involved in cell wall biosynthesis
MITNLSPSTSSAVMTALKLAAGAHVVPRTDGTFELYSNSVGQLVSPIEMALAKDLLEEITIKKLQALGVQPPYSALEILNMMPYLEDFVRDRFSPLKHRVVFIKGDSGGCAYWRCTEPTRILNEQYGNEMYVEVTNNVQYDALLAFDIIIVQRGLFGQDTVPIMAIVERLKLAGKKIVYETDDDLFTLLHDNNCFYVITPSEQQAIQWLIQESDAIFTTTPHLAKQLGQEHKTFILPNSMDFDKIVHPVRDKERDDVLFVLWHGGESHDRDIGYVSKALQRLIASRDDLQNKTGKDIYWGFMGYLPDFITQYMERKYPVMVQPSDKDNDLKKYVTDLTIKGRGGVKYIKGVKTEEFHNYLAYLEPDICYCPLLPNVKFQDSKSNIKVIESLMAGAATVASDVGPYSDIPDDVIIKARTPEQMTQGIRKLIVDEPFRKELLAKGQEWAYTNFNIKQNAKLWHDALVQIGNGERVPEGLTEWS